jgi:tetratricopeptide (TPR) repeat protein
MDEIYMEFEFNRPWNNQKVLKLYQKYKDLDDLLIYVWYLEALSDEKSNLKNVTTKLKEVTSKTSKDSFENAAIGKAWQLLKDNKMAMKFYKKSADAGNKFGQFYLGWLFKNEELNKKEGCFWYQKSADQGFFKAKRNLITEAGIPSDPNQQIKIYESYPNWPSSMTNLGIIYWEHGHKDKARSLFKKAAEMGFSDAIELYNKTKKFSFF